MFDQIFWIFIAVICAAVAPSALFTYILYLKPRMERPLPNEKYWGRWKIPLPQLGLMNDGDVTEAVNFFMSNWTKAADNSIDPQERQAYLDLRDLGAKKCHIFAQKVESRKFMYFCIGNPLDLGNHMREDKPGRFGTETQQLYIYNIQDCKSLGKGPDGFEFVSVKLGKTSGLKFTDLENTLLTNLMEATKYAKAAAISKEKMKYFEERAEIMDDLTDKALSIANRKTSEEGESRLIAGTPPLVTVTVPESKGFRLPQVKWFSGWQAFIALLAFIATPMIMTSSHIEYQDQTTVAAAVAFATFILYPFIKKVLGK